MVRSGSLVQQGRGRRTTNKFFFFLTSPTPPPPVERIDNADSSSSSEKAFVKMCSGIFKGLSVSIITLNIPGILSGPWSLASSSKPSFRSHSQLFLFKPHSEQLIPFNFFSPPLSSSSPSFCEMAATTVSNQEFCFIFSLSLFFSFHNGRKASTNQVKSHGQSLSL